MGDAPRDEWRASGDVGDIRFCARIRIAVDRSSVPLPLTLSCSHSPSLFLCLFSSVFFSFFFFFLFFFLVRRAPRGLFPLDSFLTLAVGRPIATSADSALPSYIPTPYSPIYFAVQKSGGEGGEPDLSPLNGINKLYYACTSP